MIETNELFKIIPEIEDLINFAKFEVELEVPGRSQTHKIRLQLLDENEIYQLFKQSGQDLNPADMMSRAEYMKIETLVQSITMLDTKRYKSEDATEQDALLRELRYILGHTSPYLIGYVYKCYNELYEKRNQFADEKTEELKKKFQQMLYKSTPL